MMERYPIGDESYGITSTAVLAGAASFLVVAFAVAVLYPLAAGLTVTAIAAGWIFGSGNRLPGLRAPKRRHNPAQKA